MDTFSDKGSPHNTTDAIVIGAGLAGLATAILLKRRGFSVRVLDARPRPGGRIYTITSSHFGRVNLGGEFVAGFHTAVQRWCDEFRVKLEPRGGFSATGAFPRRVLINGKPLGGRKVRRLEQELERAVDMIVKLAGDVDPVRPWLSPPPVRRLDSITVDDWLIEKQFSETFRALFSDLAPGSQSTLALLALVAGADGLPFFCDMEAFAFEEGAGALVKAFGRELDGHIHLGTPVRSVTVYDGSVLVEPAQVKNQPYRAKTVIVTPPPPCWPDLFGLPQELTSLVPRMAQNRRLSIIVYPEGRKRRADDFDAVTDGPCRLIWSGGYSSERARRHRSVKIDVLSCPFLARGKTKKGDIVDEAMTLCGFDHAKLAAAYEFRWDKSPWSRGTYPVFDVGKLNPTYNIILDGRAPIFFAGDYTIPGYAGYMEGALRSAELAAGRATRFLTFRQVR